MYLSFLKWEMKRAPAGDGMKNFLQDAGEAVETAERAGTEPRPYARFPEAAP